MDSSAPGGLVRLLSHDLKTPLGPLTLAVSNLAEGFCPVEETQGLARIALAQTDRLRRLIDAALIASGRLPQWLPGPLTLEVAVADATVAYEATGGSVEPSVEGATAHVYVDRAALRDALAGLFEVAAGDAGRVAVRAGAHGERAALTVSSSSVDRCVEALCATGASDSASAFALAARRVIEAFGGGIEVIDEGFVVWLPSAAEAGAA